MNPLDEEIDIKKTRERVQKHMRSFQRMKFKVAVNDMVSSSGSVINTPKDDTATNPKSTPMLSVIERTNKENKKIDEYLEFIICAINKMDAYERKIILMKYFYMMDDEEVQNELGYSERKVRTDIVDSEISLAYILDCVFFRVKKADK